MRSLVVLRHDDPQIHGQLIEIASGLGEVTTVDLTGHLPATYRPANQADLTLAAPAAAAIEAAALASNADLVLIDASVAGREMAGYAAGLLGCAMIGDTQEVRVEDGRLIARRSVLAGTWTTECEVGELAIITIVPGEGSSGATLTEIEPTPLDFTPAPAAQAVEVISRQKQEFGDDIPLEGARIVVCGGRGVNGDFTLVRELAAELGAAVGATRVCTDEGWIDHHAQIGQTGVSIRPHIYIGVGVSGAVHHTVGMQNSDIIIAINDDSEAPIFEIADYGVVGDLNEVVPQLLEALRS